MGPYSVKSLQKQRKFINVDHHRLLLPEQVRSLQAQHDYFLDRCFLVQYLDELCFQIKGRLRLLLITQQIILSSQNQMNNGLCGQMTVSSQIKENVPVRTKLQDKIDIIKSFLTFLKFHNIRMIQFLPGMDLLLNSFNQILQIINDFFCLLFVNDFARKELSGIIFESTTISSCKRTLTQNLTHQYYILTRNSFCFTLIWIFYHILQYSQAQNIEFILLIQYLSTQQTMKDNSKFPEDIIRKQQQQIKKFSTLPPEPQKLIKSIEIVKSKLKIYSISYAIFLLSNQFFLHMSKFQLKTGSPSKKAVINIMAVCESFSPQFFQLEKQKYKKIINQLKENKQQYEEAKKLVQQQQKNKQKQQGLKKLLQLTVRILKINKDVKQLKQAINQTFYVKRQKGEQKYQAEAEAFFEHSSNYLRFIIDNIRKKTNPSLICCKTIFFDKQQINSIEGASQQFKRYTWPINNLSIKNHVTKTIVGFMNSKGGIIYIGIMQNKEKKNEVVGISLKPVQVKQIQLFIMDIVGVIYPKHLEFQIPDNKQKVSSTAKQFIINNYIKMQFMPIVNRQTLCNIHQKSQKGDVIVSSLYIVKLIMKIGHPKHLYHVVNVDKNIDFYQRQDRNVDKKAFPDAYKQIYDRLDRFERAKKSGFKKEIDRPPFHNHCRYPMEVALQLKSDKQSSSEDD